MTSTEGIAVMVLLGNCCGMSVTQEAKTRGNFDVDLRLCELHISRRMY